MLKKLTSTISLLSVVASWLCAASAVAATCAIDSNRLSAHYRIESLQQDVVKTSNDFDVYRNGLQVAHHYRREGLTDVWQQHKNGLVALSRYFDRAQRGIEYQPNELSAAVNWQMKTQLITDQEIAGMTRVTTIGSDCYQQAEYISTTGAVTVRLTWLPQLKLIKRLQISNDSAIPSTTNERGREKLWQLTSVEADPQVAQAVFWEKDRYQSTDYADIGDSESDPFLSKMINFGFIKQAAQGFYNSNGEPMSADHLSSGQHQH